MALDEEDLGESSEEEKPKTFIEIENECREYRRVFGEIYKREIQNKHVLHPYHTDKWR